MKNFWFVFLLLISILTGVNMVFVSNSSVNRFSADMTNPFSNERYVFESRDDKIINFLATSDIHAGYHDSNSSIVINCIKDKLSRFNNRGVVIAGDLTGNIKNKNDIKSYKNMIVPIKDKVLAGFGNHDVGDSSNQEKLLNYVRESAQATVNLEYFNSDDNVPVYSWNWSGVHFVQVSIAPTDFDTTKEQNNFPSFALTKLKEDLYLNVGLGKDTPVVIICHYGYDNFSLLPKKLWWNNWQMKKFKNTVLKRFNIILILSGHKHIKPDLYNYYQTAVDYRRITNFLPGTALKGSYSQISINLNTKIIRIQRFDAVNNDKVVYEHFLVFPRKPWIFKYHSILNTYHNEYLYAANFAPFDSQRRRVFTWREKNIFLNKAIWEIKELPAYNNTYNDIVTIYNVYQDEYLYASEVDAFDSERRRVFTWIPETVAGGYIIDNRFFWKIEALPNGDVSIFNSYYKEYFYAASFAPFDSERRRVFTWIPGVDINQNQWKLEEFQVSERI